jgi:arylformamidase
VLLPLYAHLSRPLWTGQLLAYPAVQKSGAAADATVAALSPLRHLDRLHAPLVVAYGTCETSEFRRQNREFAAAVEANGKVVELLVGEHYNHFELPETLGNPYGLLGRAALELMGLASVSP